jgi:hypothetical protein
MFVTHLAVVGSQEYGLGNQMFQIASTIGVAQDHGREYVFSYWNNNKYFKNPLPSTKRGYMGNLTWVHEKSFDYNPIILKGSEPTNLVGYFQSYKYFSWHNSLIGKTFEFNEEVQVEPNKIFEENFKGKITCSISVRRGDYINYPDIHIQQPETYWSKAQDEIEKEVKVDVYLVFSDDPAWCKSNIHLFNQKGRKAVVVLGRNQMDDFVMITKCNHNIITNSTFSWWGGFLNRNLGRMVVMPKLWFGPTGPWSGPSNADDLRVPGWISV